MPCIGEQEFRSTGGCGSPFRLGRQNHGGDARETARPVAVRLMDTASGYGWISIALHWLAAAFVLTMWTIGTMSQSAPEGDSRLVDLHTTIGVSAYALLWLRILW